MNVSKITAVAVLVTSGALALGGCSGGARAGKAARTVTAAQLSESQRITRAVSADCAAYRAFANKVTGTSAPEAAEGDDARSMLAAVNRSNVRWHVPPGSNAASAMSGRLALIAAVASSVQVDAALGRSQAMTLASLKLSVMMTRMDDACAGR